MRVAKFCERNIQFTDADKAIEILRQNHKDVVDVYVTDCFRRCLRCREKPFSRIQLTTIEANNAEDLVKQILQTVQSGNAK
ncbi:MAG: DUF1450 domain-containing protein [Bacillota bacterium]|nr:DUF1450 domain-containing protein [Bacillota bacterium]MDP4155567.1 DUF1450 domain-containing protein [Bacillota bacterium]